MQYLVNVIDSRSNSATPEEYRQIAAFNDRLRTNGNWVFAGGLADPTVSTVIDGRAEQAIVTDGPFVETKEWAAGFWIIEAPDLDVALRLMIDGSRACNRRLEIRPLLAAGE